MKLEVNEYVKAAVKARLQRVDVNIISTRETLVSIRERLGELEEGLHALEIEKLELAHFLVEAGEGSAVEISAEGWKVYK